MLSSYTWKIVFVQVFLKSNFMPFHQGSGCYQNGYLRIFSKISNVCHELLSKMYNLPEYLKSCQGYRSSADLIYLTYQKHAYCFFFVYRMSLHYVLSKNVVQVRLEFRPSPIRLRFGHGTPLLLLDNTWDTRVNSRKANLHPIYFPCETCTRFFPCGNLYSRSQSALQNRNLKLETQFQISN